MLEQYIRSTYQHVFVNYIAHQIKHFLTPNQVTLMAGVTGSCIPFALYSHHTYFAFFLLLLSGFLDTLDGTLARLSNDSSEVGSLLDIFSDRVVEFAIILGLLLQAPNERALLCLLMLGSILLCVTSFLTVGIFVENQSNKSFHYSAGIIERPEAFIFFGFLILLPQFFEVIAILFITLIVLTTIVRLREFIMQFNINNTTKTS